MGRDAARRGAEDIRLVNARVVVYSAAGVPLVKVIAAECVYHLRAGVVESESDVRVESEAGVITGRGFVWNNRERVVRILSNVRAEVVGAGRLLSSTHER